MKPVHGPHEHQPRLFESDSDSIVMRDVWLSPKVDLHRHLTGSIDVETAISIAIKYDVALPSFIASELHDLLFRHGTIKNLEEYFIPWGILNRLFSSTEAVSDIVFAAVKRAADDNVKYVEFRTSPRGFLGENNPFSFDEFVETLASSSEAAEAEYGTIARFILGIPRHIFNRIPEPARSRMFSRILATVVKYPNCFVGVDLSGDEDAPDTSGKAFANFFSIARSYGLGVTVHAGECGNVENIEYAVTELKATRIGHGIASAKSSRVLSLLADSGCLLEICPTSNVLLGVADSEGGLPLELFTEQSVSYAICTDNPARCRTSLSEEFFKLSRSFRPEIYDVSEITARAIDHAFADAETKKRLYSIVGRNANKGMIGAAATMAA